MSEFTPITVDCGLQYMEAMREKFIKLADEEMSETDTRCKLIDPILHHALGWLDPHIKREEHDRADGKYLDYILKTIQPTIVVEAKKSLVKFDIPKGNNRYLRINGAIKKDKATIEGINQVRNYANNKGITYCALTNGYQWIVFRASNTQGVNWDRHFTIVFRSIDDLIEKFPLFYDSLSYEAAYEGRLSSTIPLDKLNDPDAKIVSKISSDLHIDFEARNRNALYPFTREIIANVFQSLDNSDASSELLEHCYVDSARDSGYERGIGDLLKDHQSRLPADVNYLKTSRKDAGAFQKHFTGTVSGSTSGSVSLILGTIGSGKTSFINRFRKVYAKKYIEENYIWLYLSFNDFVEDTDNLSAYIPDLIKKEIKALGFGDVYTWESLQKIYKPEIDELKTGFLEPLLRSDPQKFEVELSNEIRKKSNDELMHQLRCVKHVANQNKKRIAIVYDNADHHSPELQNSLFLIAQKHSEILSCPVFISLREESYWKNKDFGGLSAFHSTAFHISAPRFEQVLSKRFRYTYLVLQGQSELEINTRILDELDVSMAQVIGVFKTLQNTLLGEDRRFIRYLEYTNPGEVRRSLDAVARFLTSGHTNINRIVDSLENPHPVGFHEFLQSIMLGDRDAYSEEFSDTLNIFTLEGIGSQSHFSRLAILARILSAHTSDSKMGKGFVSVREVCDDCHSLGINPETTNSIIGRMLLKRLLAAHTLERETYTENTYVKATSSALYYIEELVYEFGYIDALIIDTEILDASVRAKLLDLTRSLIHEANRLQKIKIRIDRYMIFLEYLSVQYEQSTIRNANDSFSRIGIELIPNILNRSSEITKSVLKSAESAFSKIT